MAAERNADKVFVALPETYEDGLSVLTWVFSYFPQDKTKIIITHVMTSPLEGLFDPGPWLTEKEKLDLILSKYLSNCSIYKFQAEPRVHIADDIAEGIVQVIAEHGTKNLVMRSAANSDMTDLSSETANRVLREASRSCKLWFVSDGNLICTREVNSDNLTPAPVAEERSRWNGQSTEASSSTSARSNTESRTEEVNIDVGASLEEMLREASVEADNFKKKSEEIFEAHNKLACLVIELAKKLELLNKQNEQIKIENELLTSQRDEYITQIELADERRLTLEQQISDLELVIENLQVFSASAGDCIDSLQADLHNLQQERDNLVRKVEELSIQSENMHSSSSTALNSEFTLQELQQATQNFSESLKIGQGGFGPVYKGSLRGTSVAIKMLHSESLQGISQFQQEITVLTEVRHPNLVTLIGACSEVSALVYEYLSNGSLEDRLTRANNTPPLTWQARTRIIGEICLALIFLHSNKPQLVVHGDLKPDNILLDTNLVSKLGDFGISHLLKQPDTNSTAFSETSHLAGTCPYIDPEYLLTQILTPKSDTYAFGIIILRLLTGKPPWNIAKQVQDALRDGILLSVIDESAGTWPFEQAKKLAEIALRCVELARCRRPNLVNEVWPVVEPLMKTASMYVEPHGPASELGEESIPSHFICPILQDVMQNPYIAADGFTYEAEAIRQWLRSHNTSPMTNLALPHCNLIPNHVLRSAIQEWLQQHPQC